MCILGSNELILVVNVSESVLCTEGTLYTLLYRRYNILILLAFKFQAGQGSAFSSFFGSTDQHANTGSKHTKRSLQ